MEKETLEFCTSTVISCFPTGSIKDVVRVPFFGYLCVLLILVSCEKKAAAKKPQQRTVYDHQVITDICSSAAQDDKVFQSFRENPFFHLLFEEISFETGQRYLELIEKDDPDLFGLMDFFSENDLLGSPKTFDFGLKQAISPSTLRYVKNLGDFRRAFGDLSGLRIIEIGGGYGGQCKVLSGIFNFGSYTIVDLPENLALTKKYLEKHGIHNVQYLTLEELPNEATYDLVISNCGFSEFHRRYQKRIFDKVLTKSGRGFLICDVFPKHFGVTPYSKEELMEKFKEEKIACQLTRQEPSFSQDNYVLFWNNSSEKEVF